jgi:hypothetical protein
LQRLLSTAVLAGLLIATAAAFAVTERLKLEKSPVFGTDIAPHLSPGGRAKILLKLRHGDKVTVTIRNSGSGLVDTLAAGLRAPRGANVFHWNGRTDAGKLAPEGAYFVEIHLANQHRTLLLPNEIALDATPPDIVDAHAVRADFSPDGDHQSDAVVVRYSLSEPAHVTVWFRGKRIIRGLFHPVSGRFTWAGLSNGKRLPPGTYTLAVGATDLAGNSTQPDKRAHVRVTLRYITLASHRITGVRPSGRVEIGVSTDAKHYTWKLGARHGRAHGPVLSLPAPKSAGHYALVVTENGHSSRAVVIVK